MTMTTTTTMTMVEAVTIGLRTIDKAEHFRELEETVDKWEKDDGGDRGENGISFGEILIEFWE